MCRPRVYAEDVKIAQDPCVKVTELRLRACEDFIASSDRSRREVLTRRRRYLEVRSCAGHLPRSHVQAGLGSG